MKNIKIKHLVLCISFVLYTITTYAQFETLTSVLTLKLVKKDTVYICEATLLENNIPVSDVSVQFYIKRQFSLLPFGNPQTTDDNGIAIVEFPNDIPKDLDGTVTVIAKIEDDEKVGSIDAQTITNLGATRLNDIDEWSYRSLSSSREKAPLVLIIISFSIIFGIWGTIVYVVFQLVKIKKLQKNN